MKVKISIKNNLKVLTVPFIGTVVIFAPGILLGSLPVAFILFAFWIIPIIYLHLEYYFENKGMEIEFSDDEIVVSQENEDLVIINFADISEVVVYRSRNLDRGGPQKLSTESYSFARIITKSKMEITITCLMSPKIDDLVKKLKGAYVIRKNSLFCTTLWHTVPLEREKHIIP